MKFECFTSILEAKEYFVKHKIAVVGVEIMKTSVSITKKPFRGDSVFLLGNEGQGLNEQGKAICD